jgi:uncharacterized protein (DUF362 family)
LLGFVLPEEVFPVFTEEPMERRKFMKLVAGASIATALPLARRAGASALPSRGKALVPGPAIRVFLAGVNKDASESQIKQAVRSAAEAATDFGWLSKGDAVFIKIAMNSGNPYPATTSPLAVAAMVGLLKEKGAGRVIVGDMSGVEHVRFSSSRQTGSSRKLMETSGMAGLVHAAGAEPHFFEEAGWNAFYGETPRAGTHWKHPLMMPAILKEVNHIVLMPRCGRHILAGATLGLKAAVGYWRHDTRLEYHHDASTFHEKTAEANTVETLLKKQRLVATAANKILCTNGPDSGYVFRPDRGLVIASESVVAHDMVSLAWLLENRRAMPEPEKNGFMDTSRMVPRIANHVVVGWLGGWGPALTAETFNKNTLNGIWDDKALNRAYEILGGVPAVVLESSNDAVPADLKERLVTATSFSA